MTQGVLPFKYEVEENRSGMTALGGLPAYLDLAAVVGLGESVRRNVKVCKGEQGWTDEQIVLSLVLLNLAGGDCVDDVEVLEGDEGFKEVVMRVEARLLGLGRRERRLQQRRWRKQRKRALPSPSAVRRYLSKFHDPVQEEQRERGKAFIPEKTEGIEGLVRVNAQLVAYMQSRSSQKVATLDQDATLVESAKQQALCTYKGFRGYQPLNTYWVEQDMVLHSEFRDGNVPAGYQQLRVLKEVLACLPEGVEKVRFRGDTAAYQWDLLSYFAEGKDQRFGVIEFAVGVDVVDEFKRAVGQVPEEEWKKLLRRSKDGKVEDSGQEWAEVCYVPNNAARKKNGPSYKFYAIREPLKQRDLPGMEQLDLPFPTMWIKDVRYKIYGVVTNRDLPGDELIWWYRQRCGKSEEVHSVMKRDLAGGKLPSGLFGANAAWWQIMILAFNLNAIMKRLVLKGKWVKRRMKAIRLWLIKLPGRVIRTARGLLIRLGWGHPSTELLLKVRFRILELAPGPSG